MEEQELKDLYHIETERLKKYYERIKNQFSNKDEVYIIAQFLNNQSIGPPISELMDILNYYSDYITQNNTILDFAMEMIRANKIRLEYKKYLSQQQFKNLFLAIDDCIFLFFLEYDKYIREILTDDIKEFEISALYEVFFNEPESMEQNIYEILEKHKMNVPTIFYGKRKVSTNIVTLRSGLSEIIKTDYQKLTKSKKIELITPKQTHTFQKKADRFEERKFRGLLIERMVKSHCISKNPITPREIENAISQFLASYFKFGELYKYKDFKDLLIECLTDDIHSGLTERIRETHSKDYIKKLIILVLEEFNIENRDNQLDGSAWKNDLKPILKKFLEEFIDTIFD